MSAVLTPSECSTLRRRPSGNGIALEPLRDLAALRALLPDWEALVADSAEPNPFYEPWMLLAALEAYGVPEGFRCVAVWQDGTLAGLFPMRLEPHFRQFPIRTLRSWRHRNMLLCTPLIRARSAVECIGALLESRLAPVVEFEYVPASGLFYSALIEATAARPNRLSWIVSDAYVRPLLLRERDPRERFTSNLRNNLRRCEARLKPLGKPEPVRLGAGEDIDAWTEDFLRLEASGWKGQAGSALACREDDRRFAIAALREAYRRGRLLITGLDLDGRALARHCIFTAGEACFTFKIAYDEAHSKASPGLLAEVDNVRQFMETPGLRWFDSNTERENQGTGRVWKDRLNIHAIAVGTNATGRLAVAGRPLMRLVKRWMRPGASA